MSCQDLEDEFKLGFLLYIFCHEDKTHFETQVKNMMFSQSLEIRFEIARSTENLR